MADKSVDVLIIGGGLTGAALLIALEKAGLSVAMVEAKSFTEQTDESFDARSIALAPASVQILEMLGVWDTLVKDATPIKTIHVSEQGVMGSARLQRPETALGYVAEMQSIQRAFYPHIAALTVFAPAKLVALDRAAGMATIAHEANSVTIKAGLIVAADGTESTVRALCGMAIDVKAYGQCALVANIGLQRSHHNSAYERFTRTGPMAMLPMRGQRAALVWSLAPEEAKRLQQLDEQPFLKTLQTAFGYRLGRFVKVGKRSLFPLRQAIMPCVTTWPVVFIGNAAHTLHPVAGQGFNLGLRDVAALAQSTTHQGISRDMLIDYEATRRQDQALITQFTDGLIGLFAQQFPGVGAARGLGLMAFDNLPFVKKLFVRVSSGYAGVIPDLVCGIPL